MATNIRDDIVARRKARIAATGFAEGAPLPRRRETPIVPFLGEDGLICEVKRRSPSRGDIAPGLDAVDQAGLYLRAGARNLSVLTVPEGFGGSLTDLLRIKREFPGAAVLRKDFLYDTHDIDAAWRAGADAVLLIAGMLTAEELAVLYRCAKSLGLEALVEIHDEEDRRKAAPLRPNLVGINSRDLTTFTIDPLLPVMVKAGIDWPCRVVYESGIRDAEGANFTAAAGFDGLLVGEAVVRDPALAGQLSAAMRAARPARFWPEIGSRRVRHPNRPLLKICGLTREEDARLAAELGADVLGFVFWPQSPRRATPGLLRSLADLEILKVAVTVNGADADHLAPEVEDLLRDGLLDAVQLHGDERADACARLWPVQYKAIRPRSPAELAEADAYRCPRLLLDAAAPVPGGSGTRVDAEILESWRRPLWLAGGITPDNARRVAETRNPELLDLASGVEASPGVKSQEKMRRLFEQFH
ncbi:MAG: bifunctional indole-3-glycerol phosphate synthase/phosphoribosylanthranilate isomerase [Planctomycetes bacterium]|nr:bifunctional indole-3-glycerol phosphate synthase/phosphoribosylanthranilate isomerase [Planctomycetota bacterium]